MFYLCSSSTTRHYNLAVTLVGWFLAPHVVRLDCQLLADIMYNSCILVMGIAFCYLYVVYYIITLSFISIIFLATIFGVTICCPK